MAKLRDVPSPVTDSDDGGPVPEENLPGHHPDVEQDKPTGPPPRPRTAEDAEVRLPLQQFPFRFDGPVGVAARAVTITEHGAHIEIDMDRDHLIARYGPWKVETPLSNIAGASITGPYKTWKVIGPPHLSMADRGLTFATNNERGVCIRFHAPVTGIDPRGWIRHPGLTVTVADPEALVAALDRRIS